MASKKAVMHSIKKYELSEYKALLEKEFSKKKLHEVQFKNEIYREFGDTKTLLLIYENLFFRTGSFASLVILLSEYQGYHYADIISTGGKEILFSWGTENDFLNWGIEALKNIGFVEK